MTPLSGSFFDIKLFINRRHIGGKFIELKANLKSVLERESVKPQVKQMRSK